MKKNGKFKVGDRVILTKVGSQFFPTTYNTGVVKRVGYVTEDGNFIHDMISIKRDGYRGHEYTWWTDDCWRRIRG